MEEEGDEFSSDEEVEEPVAELVTVATSQPAVPQPAPSVEAQPGSLGFTKELSSLLASKMGSLYENTAETVPETMTQDTVVGNRPSVPSKPVVANKPVIGNKPSVANKPTVASKPAEVTDTERVKGSQRRRPPPPPKAKVCFINYFHEILLLVFHTV